MHRLRRDAASEAGELLCVLLVWFGAVPADPSPAFRSDRRGFLLGGLSGQYRPKLARLAPQSADESARVVDSPGWHCCGLVCSIAGSNRHLDRCAHLDGNGLHSQCKAVRANPLPLHGSILSRDDSADVGDRFWHCHGGHLRVVGIGLHHPARKQAHLVDDRASLGKILVVGRSPLFTRSIVCSWHDSDLPRCSLPSSLPGA